MNAGSIRGYRWVSVWVLAAVMGGLLLVGSNTTTSLAFNKSLVVGLQQYLAGDIPCAVINEWTGLSATSLNTATMRALLRLDGLSCVRKDEYAVLADPSRYANDPMLLFHLGWYFERKGRMQDAARLYQGAGVASFLASEAFRQGVKCSQVDDLSCQEAAWQRSVLFSPTPYFVEALTSYYLANGQRDKAADIFEQAAVATSDPVFAHLARGRAKDVREEYETAIVEFQQAASLAPDNIDVMYYLGLALRKSQRFSEAEGVLLSVVEDRPDAFWAIVALSETYLNLGQWQEALFWYDKALSERADLSALHMGRGQVLIQMGRMVDARSALSNALTIDPGNIYALRLIEQIDDPVK